MNKFNLLTVSILFLFVFSNSVLAKDGDVKICGFIVSINENQVTLNGISYQLESDTEYEDANGNVITVNDFAVGELVELKIRDSKVHELEKEDGSTCEDDDDSDDDDSDDDDKNDNSKGKKKRRKFCGQITDIGSDSITVNNEELEINSETELKSKSGEDLTLSAFSFKDFVKIYIKKGFLLKVQLETTSGCKSFKAKNKNKKKDENASTEKRTLLKLMLRPSEESTVTAKGNVKYFSRAKSGKAKDRLKIRLAIPVPSENPTLENEESASSLQLSAFLQRESENLAVCIFEFDKIEDGVAEYKIDLREKQGNFVAKKGSCDIDPDQPDIQNAVPVLKRGDDITILTDGTTELLSGQF